MRFHGLQGHLPVAIDQVMKHAVITNQPGNPCLTEFKLLHDTYAFTNVPKIGDSIGLGDSGKTNPLITDLRASPLTKIKNAFTCTQSKVLGLLGQCHRVG